MRTRRLDSLTGMRGLAAFVIFWHHAAEAGWLRYAVIQGSVAVEFFFILSGFVLMWTLDARDTAPRFYRRRFARIYPAYILAWLFTAEIVQRIPFEAQPSHGDVLLGVLLLQSWVPHEATYYAVNGPAWSLSAEAFFYLTFPLWAGRLSRASHPAIKRAAFAAVLGVFAVAAVGQLMGPGGNLLRTNPDTVSVWLVRTLPATRILEFLLGACLAVLLKRGALPRVRLSWAAAACVVSYAVAGIPTLFSSSAVMLIALMMLVVAGAQADLARQRNLFSSRWMVRAGEVSYCFYLVQMPIIGIFEYRAHSLPGRVFAELLTTLLIAVVLHRAVERPFEKLLRGRASEPAGRARAAVSAPPTL